MPRTLVRCLGAVALAALLGVAAMAVGSAQREPTATVDVRVWQNVRDDLDISISVRPEGGRWRRTVEIPLDDGVSSTGYQYGDISIGVPLGGGAEATVEIRVWQNVGNTRLLYISARPEGGSWRTLGTIRLPMEGISATGRFRYSDISLDVPIPEGEVTTIVGTPGRWGSQDGRGAHVRFGGWEGSALRARLAVDGDGNVIIADDANALIRRLSPDGEVSTIAGGGRGLVDGPGASAQFRSPQDLAIDGDGNIYVADRGNELIRKITPDGTVSTVAGGGSRPGAGPADEVALDQPRGIAADAAGNVYIAEQHRILLLSPEGLVSIFAGGATLGQVDGPRALAGFSHLRDIDLDDAGNVYVIDIEDAQHGELAAIRRIDTSGNVSTLLRSAPPALGGELSSPDGLAVTGDGTIYVANTGLNQIVRLNVRGELRGVAGSGEQGSDDGPASSATLSLPKSIVFTAGGELIVLDQNGSVLRRVAPAEEGFPLGDVPLVRVERPPRVDGVEVNEVARHFGFQPIGLAVDGEGNVIAGDNSDAIWRVSSGGALALVAGDNGMGFSDGPASEAHFSSPEGIAVDGDGNIFVADYGNNALRRIAPDGTVTTVEGIEGGGAPIYLTFDSDGDLLVVLRIWRSGDRVVRLRPNGTTSEIPVPSFDGIDGIGVDSEGRLWLAGSDYLTGTTIMRRDARGEFRTVLETPRGQYGGLFSIHVSGLVVRDDGMAYVSDSKLGRVLRISPDGDVETVVDRDDFGGSPNFQPHGIALDADGNLLLTSWGFGGGGGAIWQITLPDE